MLFEFDRYDRTLHRLQPAAPLLPYELVTEIKKVSLLYWAEHCIECAAPSCYQTCDLYQPRADLRCRRFSFGAFKNGNFHSRVGHGVEICFKKWAKMEAYGNLRLHSSGTVRIGESLVGWISPIANVAGKVIALLAQKARWRTLTNIALEDLVRRLHRTRAVGDLPDAFLLEVYNPASEAIRMHLSFSVLPTDGPSPDALIRLAPGFRQTIACRPGYSQHKVDIGLLRPVIDSGSFLISLAPEADQDARLVFLSADFVKFSSRPANDAVKSVKCVVFDLDNTLWQGTLAEGDNVIAKPETIRLLKHLDDRGILLSIASKNDRELAWGRVQKLGLAEYFLYPQINWAPKSTNIKVIAERLNIGIDALAFVDDNPFELDEVARACPAVLCVNSNNLASLYHDHRFGGSTTADAARRRELYRDSMAREIAQESFAADYLGFLASCEIHLEILPLAAEDAERVTELVQRTNQLNFSGHKHTRVELAQIFSNPQFDKLVLKSRDRFGSYGTIGFCIVERVPGAILIHDLMLSCRVQGKLLEKALFSHLLDHHAVGTPVRLWVNFHKTPRNTPAQNTLHSLDFRLCRLDSDGFRDGMILDSAASLHGDIIQVSCTCLSQTRQMVPATLGR